MDIMDYLFNATTVSPDGKYNMSILATWLHFIPHMDIKFQKINSTFDPQDNEYLESLGILVAIPGFWLILTLLFFLIFFLCRCCDVNSKKKRKLTCCKCCLFLFALISCVIITLGVYGNYQSHIGLVKVQNSTQDMSNVIEAIKANTSLVEGSLEANVDKELDLLSRRIVFPLVRNHTILNMLHDLMKDMKKNSTRGVHKISEMSKKIDGIDIRFIPDTIDQFEQIRMPATFAVLGSLGFICFVLLCGICKHSRCLLILFSVLGLLSLVVCWVLSSLYLGISIAGSDFCVDPKPFIVKQFNGIVEGTVVNYYLHCDEKGLYNPFRKNIRDVKKAVEGSENSMMDFSLLCRDNCPDGEVKMSLENMSNKLQESTQILDALLQVTECERIHGDYLDAMRSSCKDIIEGVVLMLLSAAGTGLFFTLLVLCASHTWINIRKKRSNPENEGADEADPFLPPASASSTASSATSKRLRDNYPSGGSGGGRPRYSHTPPQTPHFPGPTSSAPPVPAPNGPSVNRDDQLAFLTPPPAYEQVGQHPHPHHQHHHHHSHQAVGPHYVADSDLMMRATQATKF